jgi:hypothetical protein
MAKRIELSIKTTYLPGWGIYEGVRELIQNARDAEVQSDAKMTVKWAERSRNNHKTGAIVILNEGTTLPKEALLIGHTTKESDSRLIGKFGEGLKFGVLALLRLGVEIKIRNGSEVWVPSLERSETFNAEVLVFTVTGGHEDKNRVQFDILGVDQADWETVERKLLFIGKYPEHIKCQSGNILTDESQGGNVYVKGMFVNKGAGTFGYDLFEADIDRDRRMVNSLSGKTGTLLAQAMNRGKLIEESLDLMMSGAEEANSIGSWELDGNTKDAIAKQFARLSREAIPVESAAQAMELESYGKRGVQVPWGLRHILEPILGTAGEVLAEMRNSEKYNYGLGELTQEERDNFRFAMAIVRRAAAKVGDDIDVAKFLVVDFHKPELGGTYEPNTGVIRIARKVLTSKAKLVYTMVHEAAHTHGHDGMRSHEEAIGALMEKILEELIG